MCSSKVVAVFDTLLYQEQFESSDVEILMIQMFFLLHKILMLVSKMSTFQGSNINSYIYLHILIFK